MKHLLFLTPVILAACVYYAETPPKNNKFVSAYFIKNLIEILIIMPFIPKEGTILISQKNTH
jgi:hypothetical protein